MTYGIKNFKRVDDRTIAFKHKQSKDHKFLPWMLIHDWANINRLNKRYEGCGNVIVELPDGDYKYYKHEIQPVSDNMEIAIIYLTKGEAT